MSEARGSLGETYPQYLFIMEGDTPKAGVITISRIEELSENDWERVMTVNTKGVFLCCQPAAIRMGWKFSKILFAEA